MAWVGRADYEVFSRAMPPPVASRELPRALEETDFSGPWSSRYKPRAQEIGNETQCSPVHSVPNQKLIHQYP